MKEKAHLIEDASSTDEIWLLLVEEANRLGLYLSSLDDSNTYGDLGVTLDAKASDMRRFADLLLVADRRVRELEK